MARMIDIRARLGEAVFPAIALLLLFYFVYHGVQGEKGLVAWHALNRDIDILQQDADRIAGERLRLEHRVSLMRPESLDPDMLDEQVRGTLGFAAPRDLIILKLND